jgi:hypothetical protein
VPAAIETPRGLLVASLRATGRPMYAIDPLAVARYRERHSVARSKSDHADAMTLLRNPCPRRTSDDRRHWINPKPLWPSACTRAVSLRARLRLLSA